MGNTFHGLIPIDNHINQLIICRNLLLFTPQTSYQELLKMPNSYVSLDSMERALCRLRGSADHMLKIWFTLKQMGMTESQHVAITTSSPDEALRKLFDFNHHEGMLFVPFSHTTRFMQMKRDAGRSIIQTTIKRWVASGSVVTTDPSSYLDISDNEASGELIVKPGRTYLSGLGHGKNGFARQDNERVAIPAMAFAAWYYRQIPIDSKSVLDKLRQDLCMSLAEFELIFVTDNSDIELDFQEKTITNVEIQQLVQKALDDELTAVQIKYEESVEKHLLKVKSMTTLREGPTWLNSNPKDDLKKLVENGANSLLLYGPPRTGKTHAIDQIVPRNSPDRETIQIHDGWGYDELIGSTRFSADGTWTFSEGALLKAIREEKKYIVLEEINRTEISQSLGEVFSLIEEGYRGVENTISLREEGQSLHIPNNTKFFFTMNTLDRSTEEIDDALLGRLFAVEFPPRVEDLHTILTKNELSSDVKQSIQELFSFISKYYPIGHGYFSSFSERFDFIDYYKSKVRPVLAKHFENYRDSDLKAVDEKIDELFYKN